MDRKLRAKKGIEKYKNLNAYLDAVYRNNKSFIDSHFPQSTKSSRTVKTRFKNLVKSYIGEIDFETGKKITTKQALDIVNKSRALTSKEEHFSFNWYSALNKDKKAFNEFRKLNGWNKKINPYGFVYKGTDGKYDIYEYGNIRLKKPFSPTNSVSGFIVELIEEI